MKASQTEQHKQVHQGLMALLLLIMLSFGFASFARAERVGIAPAQAAATATTGTSDNTAATPAPVGTSEAAMSATAGAGPQPNATGGAGAAPPAQPTGGASDVTNPAAGTGADVPPSSGGFPWLVIVGVALVLVAALGFALFRPRRTVETTATASTPAQPMRRGADLRDLAAPGSATPPRNVPVAAPPASHASITCPNCGTVNNGGESFCHECGEDLRSLAAAGAGAAPSASSAAVTGAAQPVADVVDDTTPYLETLDRTAEQLEFVLSRPRIGIGTAAGNDIIIDSAFTGWQTVSPKHAELRREQDGFVIFDRDSDAGTFVNEMRTGENILADGDLIRLGDVRFVFRVPSDT